MDTHLAEQLKPIEENSSRLLKKREQWTPTNKYNTNAMAALANTNTHMIQYHTDTMVGVTNKKNGLLFRGAFTQNTDHNIASESNFLFLQFDRLQFIEIPVIINTSRNSHEHNQFYEVIHDVF